MAIINNLPSRGGVKMELLWSNPNPDSIFNPTTIQINLAKYQIVGIVFKSELGTPIRTTNIFLLMKGLSYGEGSVVGGVLQYTKSRVIKAVTDSSVQFGDGYNATNQSGADAKDNSKMIPLYIYGM